VCLSRTSVQEIICATNVGRTEPSLSLWVDLSLCTGLVFGARRQFGTGYRPVPEFCFEDGSTIAVKDERFGPYLETVESTQFCMRNSRETLSVGELRKTSSPSNWG